MSDLSGTQLPPTATDLAKAFDLLEERLFSLPIEMISKNPQIVDARLLDHLAWEESVDVWDFDWPDDVKRNVVAASVEVHLLKGTPHAIKLILAVFDVDTELLEWFEQDGIQDGLEPGSFRVTAYAGRSLYGDDENTLNNRMVADMNAALLRVTPVSRKLVFRLGEKFQTATYVRSCSGQSQRQDGATDADPRPEICGPDLAVRTASMVARRAQGEIDALPPEVGAEAAMVARTEIITAVRNSWSARPAPRAAQSSAGLTMQPAARAVTRSSEFHDIQRRA
ncbi:phage tail protein I [Antarcticimicrobium sediminis]|uniref:Phage tail protein I n=1 Tax=Antarcticimicrobium sediminis TaxID=2546227 RepID=A0A4R5EIH5_9RHOB|nr:phage tail protein I [Antarcticimicrobium sediminis]TDE34123.1 phage tail protein I [Antarcticimicrobium sediminis]